MKKMNRKHMMGILAISLTLCMVAGIGTGLLAANGEGKAAVKEGGTVCESPFTAAVQKVVGSVVGVNNYATYSNNNYGNNFFNFGGFGDFGFGFGGGNRGGNYGDSYDSGSTREVLQSTGSGVVIAEGYVLTNYHVVEGATTLEVSVNGKNYPAQLMGTDESIDIAVMFVDGLDIEPVVLGDSDVLNVGEWTIVIGNPLSFTNTTTVGVISALNREISGNGTDAYGKRTTNTMIQTDAPINSGNSGGGMFNTAGELIGVPNLKYSSSGGSGNASIEGIGMAVPINVAKPLIYQVLEGKGNVQNMPQTGVTSGSKPRIGVTVSNLSSSNYAVSQGLIPNGAYVSTVEAGSPAEKAGIQEGDIIVQINDTIINNVNTMTSMLQNMQAGDVVSVKLYRVDGGLQNVDSYNNFPDGEYLDLQVTLANLDDVRQ